jgi:hypothetical protein
MKRVTRDFITLFNKLWYRDFPLARDHKDTGSRAEWTTHIGISVRACADLMGYFTHFEQGNRTDAVIRDNTGYDVAHIEWEWWQPWQQRCNEIEKLRAVGAETDFSVLISYSRCEHHRKNIAKIRKLWRSRKYPLVFILITFTYAQKARWFDRMESYHLQNGKLVKIRSQPALPWKVVGSRWEAIQAEQTGQD